MDLTRSFIEKIEELVEPKTIEINDLEYSKEDLYPVLPPGPLALKTNSLTSIVDYLKSDIDYCYLSKYVIHVLDSSTVELMSSLDSTFRHREVYIQAKALLPKLEIDRFVGREAFNIMLQSRYVPNEDRARVLSSIAKIRYENSSKLEDDGVTQTVTSAVGVTLVKEEQIPNPVVLAPFRTFAEIEQPESPFILRVNDECKVGLFEADGGAWMNTAMIRIKDYLIKELTCLGDDGTPHCPYTIIA